MHPGGSCCRTFIGLHIALIAPTGVRQDRKSDMIEILPTGRHGRPSRTRRPLALALVAAVVLGGGTIAYAAWTASGTGSSEAKSVTAVALTVNVATATAELYPGGSAKVYFTVTNPNPYDVLLTDADFGAVTSSDEVNCPASNITVNDKTGLSLSVGAGVTSGTLTITDAVTMALAAPDGCQGKTFTVATTLTGLSV
jgi:hypothetical protein